MAFAIEHSTQVGVLLADDFPMMSYAAVVEPLRAANLLSGRPLFAWMTYSGDGAPVLASNGASLNADRTVGDPDRLDILFVILGGDPARFDHAPTFRWLRQLARQGATLGGVSGGPYALARAGLLEGRRCTIHWEHQAAFREEFPRLDVDSGLYVIDRNRMTCAGGIAGLDLVLDLIERDHGPHLADQVSGWFIRTHVRTGSDAQRPALARRYRTGNPRVLAALEIMENGLEEPARRAALAAAAGVGVRQLERLFASELGHSIAATYLRLRLDHARRLIRQSPTPLIEVALAAGFPSVGALSRAYRTRFGVAPSRDRGRDS